MDSKRYDILFVLVEEFLSLCLAFEIVHDTNACSTVNRLVILIIEQIICGIERPEAVRPLKLHVRLWSHFKVVFRSCTRLHMLDRRDPRFNSKYLITLIFRFLIELTCFFLLSHRFLFSLFVVLLVFFGALSLENRRNFIFTFFLQDR